MLLVRLLWSSACLRICSKNAVRVIAAIMPCTYLQQNCCVPCQGSYMASHHPMLACCGGCVAVIAIILPAIAQG